MFSLYKVHRKSTQWEFMQFPELLISVKFCGLQSMFLVGKFAFDMYQTA